jgi:4-diphosphocytidyl-2-C-methyl-D-erythritol kinase
MYVHSDAPETLLSVRVLNWGVRSWIMLVRSYAKINLTLAVSKPEPPTAARPGWHRIASWFHAVDVWDDVQLSRSDGECAVDVRFASGATPDWPMEKDLGYRAIKALERHVERTLPVMVRVNKRIPAGGGLGGGSSNAAAVLRGVNQLMGLGLEVSTLVTLGRTLGSDVEFFLDDVALDAPPRAAFVQGFGDQVERVHSLRDEVTLLLTGIDCPTPLVYQKFDALGSAIFAELQARHALEASLKEGRVREELLFNQLTSAAGEARPALNQALHTLALRCGQVLLSGSGSTIFTFGKLREAITGITPVATRLA